MDEEIVLVCLRVEQAVWDGPLPPNTRRCYDCNAVMWDQTINAGPWDDCICHVCWVNGRPQWSRS